MSKILRFDGRRRRRRSSPAWGPVIVAGALGAAVAYCFLDDVGRRELLAGVEAVVRALGHLAAPMPEPEGQAPPPRPIFTLPRVRPAFPLSLFWRP